MEFFLSLSTHCIPFGFCGQPENVLGIFFSSTLYIFTESFRLEYFSLLFDQNTVDRRNEKLSLVFEISCQFKKSSP